MSWFRGFVASWILGLVDFLGFSGFHFFFFLPLGDGVLIESIGCLGFLVWLTFLVSLIQSFPVSLSRDFMLLGLS